MYGLLSTRISIFHAISVLTIAKKLWKHLFFFILYCNLRLDLAVSITGITKRSVLRNKMRWQSRIVQL